MYLTTSIHSCVGCIKEHIASMKPPTFFPHIPSVWGCRAEFRAVIIFCTKNLNLLNASFSILLFMLSWGNRAILIHGFVNTVEYHFYCPVYRLSKPTIYVGYACICWIEVGKIMVVYWKRVGTYISLCLTHFHIHVCCYSFDIILSNLLDCTEGTQHFESHWW